jgi:hypothetical protein
LRREVQEKVAEINALKVEAEACEVQYEEKAAQILKDLKSNATESMTIPIDESSLLSPKKYLSPASDNTLNEEKLNKSKLCRSRWKIIAEKVMSDILMQKYNENREFIQKLHQISGTKTAVGLIEAFHTQEIEHFAKIQYVNRLAEDVEMYRAQCSKLREEIGRMKLRNDAVDVQKVQRTKALKSRFEVYRP